MSARKLGSLKKKNVEKVLHNFGISNLKAMTMSTLLTNNFKISLD